MTGFMSFVLSQWWNLKSQGQSLEHLFFKLQVHSWLFGLYQLKSIYQNLFLSVIPFFLLTLLPQTLWGKKNSEKSGILHNSSFFSHLICIILRLMFKVCINIFPNITQRTNRNTTNVTTYFFYCSPAPVPTHPGSRRLLSNLRSINDPFVPGGPHGNCALMLQRELCLRQSSGEWRGTFGGFFLCLFI